jgi:hypothetical protein
MIECLRLQDFLELSTVLLSLTSAFVFTFRYIRAFCFVNFIHECRLVISYECRLYCFLLTLLSNRWLGLKVPQDP